MNQVLQTAYDATSIKGFVEYSDFSELKPAGKSAAKWWREIKKALLDAGFVYHEKSKADRWSGKCNFTAKRTHFHLFKKH